MGFMSMVFLLILILVLVIVIRYIFEYNIKKLKQIAGSEELDEIVKKCPTNVEVARVILSRLENETVTISECVDSKTSLYIVATNKILIGKLGDSYARIQVVAHECLHSVQDKKILWFNFIFSNIYYIYFFLVTIFVIVNRLSNMEIYLAVLILFGMTNVLIKNYLETDVMIKARYLSKEYLEETSFLTKEEIGKLICKYDQINGIGIKMTNASSFFNCMIHIVIFITGCMV